MDNENALGKENIVSGKKKRYFLVSKKEVADYQKKRSD